MGTFITLSPVFCEGNSSYTRGIKKLFERQTARQRQDHS